MRLAAFVEGAWPRDGGTGIAPAPQIGTASAKRGDAMVMVMGGPPTPGYQRFVRPHNSPDLWSDSADGRFCIVTLPAIGKWGVAPSMLWRAAAIVRDADIVALHSVYSFPVLTGYLLARLYRKPYILWPHGVLAPFQRNIGRRKKWIYDQLIARGMIKGASAVVCTAAAEREQVRALKVPTVPVIIPHGVDFHSYSALPTRGHFRKRYLQGHAGPLIVYLGRLAAIKNLELLISAMARIVPIIPSARLVLIGPPDPASFDHVVADWIKEHCVESHVVVTGSITDDRLKQEALRDADLFVMPSHAENFCLALFEAMAAGLPVVVSRSINYAQEIVLRRAGLAPSPASAEFAGAIATMLNDRRLRDEMATNASNMASDYSWDASSERLGRLCRSITSRRPIPEDLVRI